MKYFGTLSIILLVINLLLNVISIIIQKENKKKATVNFIISTFCIIFAMICIILSK